MGWKGLTFWWHLCPLDCRAETTMVDADLMAVRGGLHRERPSRPSPTWVLPVGPASTQGSAASGGSSILRS